MSQLTTLVVLFVSSLAYYYYKFVVVPPHETNIDPFFRRQQIENMIWQSWTNYRQSGGWDNDIYHPLTPTTSHNMNDEAGPLGWIIIDSIDTLWYVTNYTTNDTVRSKFNNELSDIELWCENTLDYDLDSEVNLFETTIRMLGGLLSAYQMTNSTTYRNKAIELADRLMPIFNETTSGVPFSSINLHTGHAVKNHADMGASSTAEFTTLQLEFKYLSIITGDKRYWEVVEKVYKPLYETNNLLESFDGLIPIYTFPDNAKFFGDNIRMGSRGDSFYEYLLKQYLMTGETLYRKLYDHSIAGMKHHLLKRSGPNGFMYIAERPMGLSNIHSSKMDHLVCFMGGLMAMGATEGHFIDDAREMSWWDETREQDWLISQELTYTCHQMYDQTPTGLAPEIVVFNDRGSMEFNDFINHAEEKGWWIAPSNDFAIKPLDAHNLQRPETVESIMILYHLTKDPMYRQWGAKILDSFIEHSCINCDEESPKIAYTCLDNVINLPSAKRDNMESFWMAETLKYLYLLFQDDIDLTKMVFNTEAHPFPVIDPELLQKLNLTTGWTI